MLAKMIIHVHRTHIQTRVRKIMQIVISIFPIYQQTIKNRGASGKSLEEKSSYPIADLDV